MSVHTDHHPAPSQQPPKRGMEDHGLLLALGAVLIALVVFGAMVGLTMLGGGDGYAPWAP